ncbi:MAG: hypothetical protein BACC_04496 [Bacteroides sp.]
MEYISQTRLRGSYEMETTVHFAPVTKEDVYITVTITNVQVPEDATEDNFDPEWHMKNAESRIDDLSFPRKDQSWSISPQQKKCVINLMREQVTFVKDTEVTFLQCFDFRKS